MWSYVCIIPKATVKKEIYSKVLHINQNGIGENVKITYRKARIEHRMNKQKTSKNQVDFTYITFLYWQTFKKNKLMVIRV
jgi:hypothetical protein